MEIPFYLAANPTPQTTSVTPSFDVNKITNFDYNYDYQNVPDTLSTTSFWDELYESTDNTLSKANTAIWNTAEGAWESTKNVASAAYGGIKSIGSDVVEGTTSIFDSILLRVVLIFAAVIIGLMLLGKSGVLRDIVDGIKAVMG